MNNQIVIAIPTYNEIDNIHLICSRVFAAIPEATLWFIDDNSPDGTGRHLDVLADNDHRIQVFHRAGKLGVGSAHIHAIHLAYELSIDTLVTMDADLTHSPERINEMMHLLQESNCSNIEAPEPNFSSKFKPTKPVTTDSHQQPKVRGVVDLS